MIFPESSHAVFVRITHPKYPARTPPPVSLVKGHPRMVREESELCKGLLFKFNSRVSCEFAVWNEKYIGISPLHGLFWEAIQAAYREGFKIFDFGRTSPNNHTLMDFKNRWGTQVIDLPIFCYPKNNSAYITNKMLMAKRIVREVCRAVPDPIFEAFGKFLYRHMG